MADMGGTCIRFGNLRLLNFGGVRSHSLFITWYEDVVDVVTISTMVCSFPT